MSMEMMIFHALAGLATLTSIMVVISRNAVTSAIFLVVNLFIVAAIYAKLGADFLAAIQVIVYAGAIMVLFIFVIMLLNLRPESLKMDKIPFSEIAVLILTLVTFGIIGVQILSSGPPTIGTGPLSRAAVDEIGGNTVAVGKLLFSKYVWPFEMASILILLAIVASVVIARKHGTSKGQSHGSD